MVMSLLNGNGYSVQPIQKLYLSDELKQICVGIKNQAMCVVIISSNFYNFLKFIKDFQCWQHFFNCFILKHISIFRIVLVLTYFTYVEIFHLLQVVPYLGNVYQHLQAVAMKAPTGSSSTNTSSTSSSSSNSPSPDAPLPSEFFGESSPVKRKTKPRKAQQCSFKCGNKIWS